MSLRRSSRRARLRRSTTGSCLLAKLRHFPPANTTSHWKARFPYDFRKIEGFAKIFNSEIEREEALELAEQQIDASHRFLLQQDVDKIIEMKNEFNVKGVVYLHAPVWFIKYEYKGNIYQLIIDGAEGMVLKGDIPPSKFGLL